MARYTILLGSVMSLLVLPACSQTSERMESVASTPAKEDVASLQYRDEPTSTTTQAVATPHQTPATRPPDYTLPKGVVGPQLEQRPDPATCTTSCADVRIRVFKLRNTQADEVIIKLRHFLKSFDTKSNKALAAKLTVAADTRSNSIIAAGKTEYLRLVAQFIKEQERWPS